MLRYLPLKLDHILFKMFGLDARLESWVSRAATSSRNSATRRASASSLACSPS